MAHILPWCRWCDTDSPLFPCNPPASILASSWKCPICALLAVSRQAQKSTAKDSCRLGVQPFAARLMKSALLEWAGEPAREIVYWVSFVFRDSDSNTCVFVCVCQAPPSISGAREEVSVVDSAISTSWLYTFLLKFLLFLNSSTVFQLFSILNDFHNLSCQYFSTSRFNYFKCHLKIHKFSHIWCSLQPSKVSFILLDVFFFINIYFFFTWGFIG